MGQASSTAWPGEGSVQDSLLVRVIGERSLAGVGPLLRKESANPGAIV